jgi:hypothetical protein
MSAAPPTPAPIPALAAVESPDEEGALLSAFAPVEDVGVAVAEELPETVLAVAIVAPTNYSNVSMHVTQRSSYNIGRLHSRRRKHCRLSL